MRDPARIDSFCRKLACAWHKIPDYRFGQIVSCISDNMNTIGIDSFYPEDNVWLHYIEEFADKRCDHLQKEEALITGLSEEELDKLWDEADSYESFKHMLKLKANPAKKQRTWSAYTTDKESGYEYSVSRPKGQSAKVKVRISDGDDGYLVGTASCAPGDKFDLRTGIQLAAARAEAKMAAADHNFMVDMLYEYWLNYMEAVHRVDTLIDNIYERTENE